ncbi:hypothetical protein A9Q97_06580 [Rhodospirillales bacterium 47_12_T64]|nr:hypothetical protein A9Q97_06580 [Rhodospirillales bacterium 47_12_T64]
MSKTAIFLSLISLSALAGCQTAGDYWSDWEGIPYQEAVLKWEPSQPTDLYARKLSYNGAYQEHWTWDSGTVFVETAGHAYHFRKEPSPEKFGEFMGFWNAFENTGQNIKASQVTEIRNKFGKFFYADIKNDSNEDCWAFLQAMPGSTPAGYVDTGKPGGYITGYDCGSERTSKVELLQFANNFSYQ